MIKSYFLVALRSLQRNKLHASINIIGLAIGMVCCILIALFVQFELGYDRQNKNAHRIYRLAVDLEANNWAISAFPFDDLADLRRLTAEHLAGGDAGSQSRLAKHIGCPPGTFSKFINGRNLPAQYRAALADAIMVAA